MALDKLVDSTQLDADLASVADAIRTKGGTSASLAFPEDFVDAIEAISGGDIEHVKVTVVPTTTANTMAFDVGTFALSDFYIVIVQSDITENQSVEVVEAGFRVVGPARVVSNAGTIGYIATLKANSGTDYWTFGFTSATQTGTVITLNVGNGNFLAGATYTVWLYNVGE